ncbi:beta-glucosidase-like glycosyl hydrolase [Balneicella halophila]|uniref:beta-N-acetylhexosaminidase n=1 Tax=Balneicella halophila TaxID=1537566 RepID=A0A7L4UNF3_BALHA|nr:glycoside hydrolase family 3 N-terminal domain-containing protein [Balneicella halophila]PVX50072.1 beta-glucosidase-like glycosyl hydrolase [Balneicella halophila]
MRKIIYTLALLLAVHILSAQYNQYLFNRDAPFNYIPTQWADSLLQSMTPDERIGQLFMVATYATNDQQNNKTQIETLIKKYHIGGLIFMQGSQERQVQLINHYQSFSKTPLLVGMDLETGLGFRMKNTVSFPKNMTLGAITDDNLIYKMAREIGRQCRRIGVHVNFAPVLDINNNRANPIIGTRSFGEDRENVVAKGKLFMEGLQDEHILAVGKHFPGHGDTKVDSHHTLPSLYFKLDRLDSLELYPFKMLCNYGIGGIMTAHLQVPEIDKEHPTSLSYQAITEILRYDIGFNGLVFTDALNMGGVANTNKPGDVDLLALLAGNDVLLFSQNVPRAIKKIKEAIQSGKITQTEIDEHVRKILLTKQWVGLNNWTPIPNSNLREDLHSTNNDILQEKLAKASITLIKNQHDFLPLKALDKKRIAAVAIDASIDNPFLKRLSHYTDVDVFAIPRGSSQIIYDKALEKLKHYNTVIVSKHSTNYNIKKKFGATNASIRFLQKLDQKTNTIFSFFGSPYGLSNYNLSKCTAVLVGYEDTNYAQEAMAQAIFGGSAITGKLPLGINQLYPACWGIDTEKVRLGYSLPETEGFIADSLKQIDSIVYDAIKKGALPGAQILLAKDGNIVLNKSYGYHTYKKKQAVKSSDLYDLASLTKVSATLPILMKHYDKDLLTLSTNLSELLPFFENTDKASITLEDLLTHESGLPSWIPLYRILIDTASYDDKLISYRYRAPYTIQIDRKAWINRNFKYKNGLFNAKGGIPVGENLYLSTPLRDMLLDTIKKVTLKPNYKKRYRYSDLGFILTGEYLKASYDFEETLATFYAKLGAKTTGMNMWKKYTLDRFVPTAQENFLRKKLLRGYVHDPNAALLGGVAGHAGLFSNAEDLAKIWQMYLHKGSYGGETYINPNTMELFSKQIHPEISRRGIGFDKPDPDTTKMTAFSKVLPLSTFGHTGFTGTMVWADPENQIIGIILANRVYPNDWNNKMGKMDIRTKIQEAVYRSIQSTEKQITPLLIQPEYINPIAE